MHFVFYAYTINTDKALDNWRESGVWIQTKCVSKLYAQKVHVGIIIVTITWVDDPLKLPNGHIDGLKEVNVESKRKNGMSNISLLLFYGMTFLTRLALSVDGRLTNRIT